MAFKGTEGEFISLDEAGAMTAAWRNGGNGDIKGVFFGRDNIEALLNQEGSMGIRMYFAENDNGDKTLVLVSADENGSDMLSTGKVLDHSIPCPADCSPQNVLNG